MTDVLSREPLTAGPDGGAPAYVLMYVEVLEHLSKYNTTITISITPPHLCHFEYFFFYHLLYYRYFLSKIRFTLYTFISLLSIFQYINFYIRSLYNFFKNNFIWNRAFYVKKKKSKEKNINIDIVYERDRYKKEKGKKSYAGKRVTFYLYYRACCSKGNYLFIRL